MSQNSRDLSTADGAMPPGGRPPSAPSPTQPEDQRLAVFAKLIEAVDHADTPGALAATRQLRKLGFSVVITGTTRAGGGR